MKATTLKHLILFFALSLVSISALFSVAAAEETTKLYVGPQLVECVGVGPQDCMLVKGSLDSEWIYFYDKIEGFDFEHGFEYELAVLITDVENPPADASSKKYTLLEVVEKKSSTTFHFPYKGVCAPGFVPLGEICVLNDRCGPGAYPEKVCIMDGKEQPYLRPLHQKHAGISIDNIICAEGKELIFKPYDISPACINSDSIALLLDRGWSLTKPVMACTLEYAPICGLDGITYGNKCMLNAQHMIMKHQGECSMIKETKGIFEKTLRYTTHPPAIDAEKGYFVTEIADNVYWLIGSGYQTMFVTTVEGVVVVDAPKSIGEKYLDAINDVTTRPITHMIYSHHHQDHTGSAGQIFPEDITYISHKETADVLAEENDPNRPVPTQTFDGDLETLTIGNQVIELHHLGNFHSNGDVLILLPKQNVAMIVDLLRPAASPYKAFGVTPDIDLYLQTHDALQDFDFDVLISGHTGILATKNHIKTNKDFTLAVMDNAKMALENGDQNPVESCVQVTMKQWNTTLAGLDTFLADHCQAMIDYHNLQ